MSSRIALFAFVAGAVAATPCLAADASMLNLLMPDAKVVTGVDIERTRNSPFGQYFLKQFAGQESGLKKFTEMTGFDPRRDVFELIMASSESGAALSSGTGGVVIARGTFDPAKLTQLAGVAGSAVTSYNGTQVVQTGGGKNGENAAWAGFLGDFLVAGPQASVKAVIDRYRSAKKTDALLVSRIQAASSKHDAWFLTTMSPAAFAGNLDNPDMKGAMAGDLVQGIESITAGVKFGANVIVSGEAMARSGKDASALVDVLRFFASMAQSNGAKGGPLGLLDAVQLTADGRTVKFSLSTPEQEFEKLFVPGMNRVRSRARAVLD